MFGVPNWIAGAALSLVVILLGNLIQSWVEDWREQRRHRRNWYEETATLARQMQDIYERRKSIHDQRREASEGLRKEMSSGVKHEIQEELREKMDELDAHTRTDFPIEGEVMDAIDSLDQMIILAKREGIDDHIDDIIDQCDILAAVAAASADAHDSRLI